MAEPSAESVQRGPAPRPPPVESDDTLVDVAFVTTARAVAPGATFWLAAEFDIADEYRIFWVNPGDEGKQTHVEFSVPAGFEVSEARYVPPTKFELPGARVSYGYEGRTAVFAKVRAAPDLDRHQTYRFEAEASWLACKQRCFPESTSAFIELGVSDSAEQVEFEDALVDMRGRLPRPLAALSGVSYQWRRGGWLRVSAADTGWIDFMPARTDDPKLVDVGINEKGNELKLHFESGSPGSRVRGLAVAKGDGGPEYVELDIPWPE